MEQNLDITNKFPQSLVKSRFHYARISNQVVMGVSLVWVRCLDRGPPFVNVKFSINSLIWTWHRTKAKTFPHIMIHSTVTIYWSIPNVFWYRVYRCLYLTLIWCLFFTYMVVWVVVPIRFKISPYSGIKMPWVKPDRFETHLWILFWPRLFHNR